MEKQFEYNGCVIHAPLGGSLIHGTMRACDLVPVFLNAIRDTPEYEQIMLSLNGANWDMQVITDPTATDNDERWNSDIVCEFLNDTLWEVLLKYSPDGYCFNSHPGDGSDYGYWPIIID